MARVADQGHGKVTFTGAIIDYPCSINPDSIEQTVELGQITNAALKGGCKSTPRNFTIGLENCSFGSPAAKNKVALTFTGMESVAANGLLGIAGTVRGASVAITDSSGALIKLGTPTKQQTLQDGNNNLTLLLICKVMTRLPPSLKVISRPLLTLPWSTTKPAFTHVPILINVHMHAE